jgi:hypothetical protein
VRALLSAGDVVAALNGLNGSAATLRRALLAAADLCHRHGRSTAASHYRKAREAAGRTRVADRPRSTAAALEEDSKPREALEVCASFS